MQQMVRLEDVLAAPEAPDLAPLLLRHEARSLRDIRSLLAPVASCMEACANPGAPVAKGLALPSRFGACSASGLHCFL